MKVDSMTVQEKIDVLAKALKDGKDINVLIANSVGERMWLNIDMLAINNFHSTKIHELKEKSGWFVFLNDYDMLNITAVEDILEIDW